MSIVHFVLAMRLPFNSGRNPGPHNSGPPPIRQLHIATENLDKDCIFKILRTGVDPRQSNNNGDSVLHLAFKRLPNHSSIVQTKMVKVLDIYLKHGINVNRKNAAGKTVLYLAIKKHLDHVTKFLLEQGARFDPIDTRGNTSLHFMVENEFEMFRKDCSRNSAVEQVVNPKAEVFLRWLVSKANYVDYKNYHGDTPLSLAAKRNLLHIVLILLKYTNNLAYVDETGKTIFHIILESIAHFNNYKQLDEGIPTICYDEKYVIQVVTLMLDKGFSIDAEDKNGDTPIFIALKNKEMELVRVILEHPIKSMKKDIDGFSLVQLAIMNKNMRIVRFLKQYGVDFSVKYRGNNLLHLLCTNNVQLEDNNSYEVIVDFLINEGCDVNARNDESMTPLHLASQTGLFTIAKRLIEHGANVHSREIHVRRFTPIHAAVHYNHDDVIEVLVNAGADINARTANGQTPLHLAMLYKSDTVRTLLRLGAHVDMQDDEGRAPLYDAICYHNVIAIRELLNYGVDINEPGVYGEIMNLLEVEPVMTEMVKHWLKLQAAGLPAANFYRYQAVDRSFKDLYHVYLEEAQCLKDCLLNDGTSMYQLLHMNPNLRCNYMTTREMKHNLLSPKLKKLFPNYDTLIKACYHEAIARCSLLEPAKCAWNELTEISLPELCLDKILSYLNNMTLRIMVSSLKGKSLRKGSYDSC